MRLTIARMVVATGFILFGLLSLTLGLSNYALYQLRVGGPNYERIVAGKDLVADILPPPLYIVESYLDARLALDRPHEVQARKARFAQLKKDFDDRKAVWDVSTLIPGDLRELLTKAAAGEALKFWAELEQRFLPALERNDVASAERIFKDKLTSHYTAHRELIDRVVTQANEFAAGVESASNAQKSSLETIVFASAGLMLLTLGLAIFFLKRHVATPIVALAGYLGRLARGDYQSVVPFQARKDEIGDMSKAVGTLRLAAMEKHRLESDAEAARLASESERARREAEKAEEARQAQATISALGEGLGRVAGGDLVFRIETPFASNAEGLRDDFNAAVDKLRATMQTIVASAQAMSSGTQEISSASNDLSRRTENQASSLEETAAALDEITATVRKAAEGAAHARTVVTDTREDAEKSGEVVRKAVEAMGGIEKSSKQIGQIIGVIDEIAFQTNLLALNAGVEAARAGDAGRGFAVVASEVRALAQRSAEAAREIKDLISNSTAQVSAGVQFVGETGEALQRILTKVIELSTVVSDIASGAQEQAAGLAQVNIAINEMDKVTQQNAAMAEQATAAGRSLSQEAEQLSAQVGQFRLGNVAQLDPQRRAALKSGGRPSAAVHPLRAAAGRNGAAAPKPAEDGWKDF